MVKYICLHSLVWNPVLDGTEKIKFHRNTAVGLLQLPHHAVQFLVYIGKTFQISGQIGPEHTQIGLTTPVDKDGIVDMMFLIILLYHRFRLLYIIFQQTNLTVFVSGVQLSANDMLKVGDWIAMPKYGADGTVIEVTLNTVKVRNWDNTITTIPPYLLVSDSFQNWRGMRESGGRRVKRSINIDMNSVRFCTPEMLTNTVRFVC